MKNTLAAVVVLVAAQAFAKDSAPPSRFQFKIPEGWVDKTPAEARDRVRLAFDEPNHLSFQAKVSPGAEPVSLAFVDKYVIESQKAVKRLTGRELKVIKKDGFGIAGIIGARFIFETPPPANDPEAPPARQVQYYVPAGDQHAVITFTAPAKIFDQYIGLFDKTAAATTIKK
ncbi:MAG: hypothetical protein JWM53_495 [bacterium]|nr:hypothetical protein [bacterium]